MQPNLAHAKRQLQAARPGLAVRGAVSPARAWHTAVVTRLASRHAAQPLSLTSENRMNYIRSIPLIGFAIAGQIGFAADVDVSVRSHQLTTSPPSARYELMQSTLAARWTFRLDRYTGRVWQLARSKDDENVWEEMRVFERPTVQAPTRPRFQLFTSGLAARHTFLLDGDTGKTWLVVTGKRKENDGTETEYNAWQPFAE